MADWRQIQARIRKAKLSADPVTGLTRIYERTHDGMAAFELATVLESAVRNEEALNWYTRAWQRFRRDDWKQKSAEAIERLGGPPPQELPGAEMQTAAQQANEQQYDDAGGATGAPESAEFAAAAGAANGDEPAGEGLAEAADEAEDEGAEVELAAQASGQAGAAGAAGSGEAPHESIKKRSRRGRRGGRRHRRKREREAQMKAQGAAAGAGAAGSAAGEGEAEVPQEVAAPLPAQERGERRERGERERGRDRGDRGRDRGGERGRREAEPQESLPFDGVRVGSEFAAQSRAVDPGLASRMAKLEAKLRRLMASPAVSMEDIDSAPAGPGVFVLSDEDHTTYYYVENCRTLRIAIANIARARTMEGSLKEKFAEHLGISESNVGKYVKEHCVVRWLQMDEDASRLAHFAIAVLGPVLNE
jgi:hypothetical protein